jgi:flagellar basal body-associated protein FliL
MTAIKRIFRFYYEGFKSMTIGKTLWIIILIKLFVMFAVLKIFFFPNILKRNFKTDEERSNYVIEQLTNQPKK